MNDILDFVAENWSQLIAYLEGIGIDNAEEYAKEQMKELEELID